MFVQILALVVCAITAILFIYVRVSGGNASSVMTKAVASFAFVLAGFIAFTKTQMDGRFLPFVVMGFVCGLIGDILLELKVVYPIDDNKYFMGGVFAFLLGHFFYAFAICEQASSFCVIYKAILIAGSAAVLLSSIVMLVAQYMKFNFDKQFWLCYVYCFVLSFMMLLCIYLAIVNIMFVYLAVAFGLFFVSDLVLSMQYFGNKDTNAFSVLNLSTYYAAQIMIVVFLIFA